MDTKSKYLIGHRCNILKYQYIIKIVKDYKFNYDKEINIIII